MKMKKSLVWLLALLLALCIFFTGWKPLVAAYGFQVPDQGPLHQECRVLVTRPQGRPKTISEAAWDAHLETDLAYMFAYMIS